MQIPELAHAIESLLGDLLPNLLELPERGAGREADRILANDRARVVLVWDLIRDLLGAATLDGLRDYVQRGQLGIARGVLGDRLREILYKDEAKALELHRLLNAPREALDAEVVRRFAPPPPPAYFRSLTISNVKCFGPTQRLDMTTEPNRTPARWTIILGENGTGKTTLLQALAAMSPTEGAPLVGGVSPGRVVARFGGDIVVSNWVSEGIERRPGARLELVADVAYGARLSDGPPSQATSWGVVSEDGLGMFGEGDYSQLGGLAVFAYGASRRMGDASLAGPNTKRNTVNSLFFEQGVLLNAEEWLLQADYAATKAGGGAAVKYYGRVRDALLALLPDVTDIRVAVGRSVPRPGVERPRVEFETPYGWIGMRQMSLGYRTLAAWTVDLASGLFDRYPDSDNPLAEAAVVLVDEIDLHLHPSWQRDLISLISHTFPNTQFVVTSHSPLIVQASEQVNPVLLRRDGDHVIIDNDIDVIRGWRVDQVLTSDLFGLESARPAYLEPLIERRRQLLALPKLSAEENRELARLEEEIGPLPTGESKEDIEAMEIIRRAADQLRPKVG